MGNQSGKSVTLGWRQATPMWADDLCLITGNYGTEMGNTQVGLGSCTVAKSWNIVAGETKYSYITIIDIV